MWMLRRLSAAGLLLGTLFFAFSLTPSLLPRTFQIQGIIAGLSFGAGYALGFLATWLWLWLGMPVPRTPVRRVIKASAAVFCLFVAIGFLLQATTWQNTLRGLMGMQEVGGVRPFSVAAIAGVVFAGLWLLAFLFRKTFQFLSRRLQRLVPPRVSHLLGLVAAFGLFWSVIDGVIFTFALRVADNSYQQVDVLIQDDLRAPTDPLKTGSAASLVSWEHLGSRGRPFVIGGPDAQQIAAATDRQALEPIRVYVGLNAADTPQQRARLALNELLRVGGFDRSVLVLATPTGRGWVNPNAQDTLEYVLAGDVATVAAQYSYLPSPLSLLFEGEYGVETAQALFQVVYGYWTGLPETQRPRLYLTGLSLGALNSDRSFDIFDVIEDPFHGALWAGPPYRSETWRHVRDWRDPASPGWLPQFRDGSVVRFTNQHQRLRDVDGDWGRFRIGFLLYGSDPVTFFDPRALFREPAWMRGERAPDVSPDLRWFPVVTLLQLTADILSSSGPGSAPPGHGHEYSPLHYIDAWVDLIEPDGWTESDSERLRAYFSR
jgi:uncharacterized membrane protein